MFIFESPQLSNTLGNGNLINGDCLEEMKKIPDESIDMVLTDPPYGINYLSPRTKNHEKIINDENLDVGRLYSLFLPEVKRVLKKGAVACFCSAGGGGIPSSALATLEVIKHLNLIQTVIWSKGVTEASFMGLGWRYRPSYETIIIASKGKDYKWTQTSRKINNIFNCKTIIPQKDDHPTPKPVKLMQFFIENHSEVGDIVLDPFLGSGTTAIACEKLQRRWIGIEISKEYCELARKRIEPWVNQTRINAFGQSE